MGKLEMFGPFWGWCLLFMRSVQLLKFHINHARIMSSTDSPSYTQMVSLLYANVNEPSSEKSFHKPTTIEWRKGLPEKGLLKNMHVRVFAQEHHIMSMSPAGVWTQTARSGVQQTNQKATVPLTKQIQMMERSVPFFILFYIFGAETYLSAARVMTAVWLLLHISWPTV